MVRAYSNHLANAKLFGFCRVLSMWTGSIYKLIWAEMGIYFLLYYAYWAVVTFALDKGQRLIWLETLQPVDEAIETIPIEFLLGFYVAYVSNRWWEQYTRIPWVDKVCDLLNIAILETSENAVQVRALKRRILRYLKLGEAWLYRDICPAFTKKMRTQEDILRLGLATEEEVRMLSDSSIHHSMYWLPFTWATQLVNEANNRKWTVPFLVRDVIREIGDYKDGVDMILKYATVPVPLCYTQVVTIALYGYFACALFTAYTDLYLPTVLLVKFVVYFGWLKVAESLICPYGDLDDNDFDMIQHFHRNLQVGYAYLDKEINRLPSEDNFNDLKCADQMDSNPGEIQPERNNLLYSIPGQNNNIQRSELCSKLLEDVPKPKLGKKTVKELLKDDIPHKNSDLYHNKKLYLFDQNEVSSYDLIAKHRKKVSIKDKLKKKSTSKKRTANKAPEEIPRASEIPQRPQHSRTNQGPYHLYHLEHTRPRSTESTI